MDYMSARMDDQITGAISENERLMDENARLRPDALRFRWLLAHADTTANLWRLLAKGGPANSEQNFLKMIDRIRASEQDAFERGRASAHTQEGNAK